LHGTTPAVCLSRRLWVRHAQDHAIMIAKCSCFCYGEWFCIHDARVDAFACFFLSKLAPSSTKHALKYWMWKCEIQGCTQAQHDCCFIFDTFFSSSMKCDDTVRFWWTSEHVFLISLSCGLRTYTCMHTYIHT
jgi:hypothetical protein